MNDITELAQSLKAAAEKAADNFDPNMFVQTRDILALVEALEKAQAQSSKWLEAYHKTVSIGARYEERIAELEEAERKLCAANVTLDARAEQAERERENWRTSFDNERFRADKLKAHIDDIEPVRAAAERLVRCKGRYHSEQNYRALAALFGVTTPDLPPLEHENVHYADAAEMEISTLRKRIAELESRTVTIEPFRSFVTDADLSALHRFAECCDDPESGGHDLEKEQVLRLEAIGALRRYGCVHWITGFGDALISITAGIKWEAE